VVAPQANFRSAFGTKSQVHSAQKQEMVSAQKQAVLRYKTSSGFGAKIKCQRSLK